MLEKFFKLRANGTTVGTEVVGGATTFMTLSYIVFVQPIVLSGAGMDQGAVMVATCVSSAIACLLMAFLANYPIALAPAMGHNFYFAVVVATRLNGDWQTALGAVMISGALFVLLSIFGVRARLISIVPESLRHAIAVGIGLLIALYGLQSSGILVNTGGRVGPPTGIGSLSEPAVLLAIFGLAAVGVLMALRIKGAILISILLAAVAGLFMGIFEYEGTVSVPPSVAPTLFRFDIVGAFKLGLLDVIFVFFFLDLFDTIGTLIAVGEQGGFMKPEGLPRARQALLSDAIGTVAGAALGTSTVTSYVESASGIAQGARTGLASVVTAALMLLALFFSPLVKMVSAGHEVGGVMIYPAIGPALVVVGAIIMSSCLKIAWRDMTEALPCFLTITVIGFTMQITEGIAFGFITYSFLKLITGRGKKVHWLLYLLSVLFILRFVFLQG